MYNMSERSGYESDSKPPAQIGESGKLNSNKRRLNTSTHVPPKKRTQTNEDNSDQSTIDKYDDDQLTIDQHRHLVQSIYEIGLAEASPLLIFENMTEKIKNMYPELNIEKLKSKLQKYRKNKHKFREEFMKEYDENLKNMFGGGATMDSTLSSGGQDIAYLTYCDIIQPSGGQIGASRQQLTKAGLSSVGSEGSIMALPILTPAEMRSPIGQSFEYFLALFESLRSDLYEHRSHMVNQQSLNQNNPREPFNLPIQDEQDSFHFRTTAQIEPDIRIVNLDRIENSETTNEEKQKRDEL